MFYILCLSTPLYWCFRLPRAIIRKEDLEDICRLVSKILYTLCLGVRPFLCLTWVEEDLRRIGGDRRRIGEGLEKDRRRIGEGLETDRRCHRAL